MYFDNVYSSEEHDLPLKKKEKKNREPRKGRGGGGGGEREEGTGYMHSCFVPSLN